MARRRLAGAAGRRRRRPVGAAVGEGAVASKRAAVAVACGGGRWRMTRHRRTGELTGGGRHGTAEWGVLFGPARHEMGPWARAWAVGAACGLARHGPLRSWAGPGTARR